MSWCRGMEIGYNSHRETLHNVFSSYYNSCIVHVNYQSEAAMPHHNGTPTLTESLRARPRQLLSGMCCQVTNCFQTKDSERSLHICKLILQLLNLKCYSEDKYKRRLGMKTSKVLFCHNGDGDPPAPKLSR